MEPGSQDRRLLSLCSALVIVAQEPCVNYCFSCISSMFLHIYQCRHSFQSLICLLLSTSKFSKNFQLFFIFYPSPTSQKYLQEQFPVLQVIRSSQNSQSIFIQDGNIVKETRRLIFSLKHKLILLFRIRVVLCSAECMYVSPKVATNGNELL